MRGVDSSLILLFRKRWTTEQERGARHTAWSALTAGNVVAVLPLVAAFVLAQRHFAATMSFTGPKG
jgi:ABC-type glycerol-3-phosphate transport system permease component